jgi:hypothetical protein
MGQQEERKRMPGEPEFRPDLPSEETIEEGRRSSVVLGLIIGGLVVGVGIIAYMVFSKFLTF